jgi:ubiquinone biosynthesis accessory factor UbiJ
MLARVIETALNSVLVLDVKTRQWLEQHNGKVIQFDLTDIKQQFYLVIEATTIFVYTIYTETPHTIIRGSCLALSKQIKSSSSGSELSIEGDVELAQDLQLLLKNLDINWEEYLSYFLGDVVTHRISQTLQQVKSSTHSFKQRGLEDLLEFIQEEKRFLPTKEEVEDFYEDLGQCRHAIDRLEARLMRLKESIKP